MWLLCSPRYYEQRLVFVWFVCLGINTYDKAVNPVKRKRNQKTKAVSMKVKKHQNLFRLQAIRLQPNLYKYTTGVTGKRGEVKNFYIT